MITTIHVTTYSLLAYAAIHPIVIKSNVIKRRWDFVCFHCTIRTRKGKETVEVLQKALDDAEIHHRKYKIIIDD